ncbi:hypothetical protein, partial [Desulfovibrio piger]|uniref:hypothetical protein n=1 Tax=Desulfovibrio piger TaxID=901 RepID=UPI0026EED7D6
NGFMRLFNSTVKHFSAKNLWIYSPLTDYSTNIPKRHRKIFDFLQAISFPRAQGLPIESGRNHRSACF